MSTTRRRSARASWRASAAGEAIALISDAGTPLVSDPGYKLVRDGARRRARGDEHSGSVRHARGAHERRAFRPTRSCLRASCRRSRARGARASTSLRDVPATLVFFETAPRLAKSLADMAEVLGAREAAVARELTKLHETVTRGTFAALARSSRDPSSSRASLSWWSPRRPWIRQRQATRRSLPRFVRRSKPRASATPCAASPRNSARAARRVYELGLALTPQARLSNAAVAREGLS